MISRQAVVDAVERAVGHSVPEWLWGQVVDEAGLNRITRSRNPEPGILGVIRTIQEREREMALHFKSMTPAPRRQVQEREVPGDRRLEALSAILALEADPLDEVKRFRRRALRGRLIQLDEVAAWIERRVAREGEPTRLMQVQVGDDGKPLPPAPDAQVTVETISYPGADGWVASRPIRLDGTLGKLCGVSRLLERRYDWPQAEAVAFLLTGRPPLLPLARARLEWRPLRPALSRVVLELSPRLTAPEVGRLYLEARSGRLFGDEKLGLKRGRVRAMSDEAARLAVFIVEQNDGRPWEQAMREWNRLNPKAQKTSVPAFTRSAREAYERVTGQPLAWKRGRGEKVTTRRPPGRSRKG